jgi:hypothetical protein
MSDLADVVIPAAAQSAAETLGLEVSRSVTSHAARLIGFGGAPRPVRSGCLPPLRSDAREALRRFMPRFRSSRTS